MKESRWMGGSTVPIVIEVYGEVILYRYRLSATLRLIELTQDRTTPIGPLSLDL